VVPPANAGLTVADAFEDESEMAAPVPHVSPHALFELVYRQMRKLVGYRDFDELVQIAAEQALRALPSYKGRCQLSTWTFRICYLTVRKHDRWYRRWLRRFAFTPDGEVPDAAAEPEADDRLARTERATRLRAALDHLSVKQRTVVVLHDLEELSIDEIAQVVGAAPAAVRSRLRDGRRALATLLKADPYFGDAACRGEGMS
jgi:RNA polymerase sigma-70 factor (ECF subfamily)